MNSDARAEVLKAHAVYEAAFNANDIAALNACLVSPFTFIGDGNAQSMNGFPFNPKEFKASKGWVSNEGTVIDLVAVGETKAHLVMRNTRRLLADGSLVEEASAFYAYTRTADGWKMFALSGIPLPT